MNHFATLFLVGGIFLSPLCANAQKQKLKDDDAFIAEKPTIGDTLADLTVFDPDGKEIKTRSLRGHHTVLVFGCLT